MRIFDRIREWASASDDDKVQLDRRAFLKGMAVTSAGLLVPGAAVFDMGRIVRPEAPVPKMTPQDEMEIVGRIQLCGTGGGFAVGDLIQIGGTGTDNDGKYYVVSAVQGSDLCVAERTLL